jgi:CheY-like chemotaxis protein/DNA-directed RNA polymerase specialized sigma24 family protein
MTFSRDIAHHLPFLRRYARALTGSQARGDAFVRATLETILNAPDKVDRDLSPRVALYRVFHIIWTGTHGLHSSDIATIHTSRTRLVERVGALSLLRREALLLTAMEGFSPMEAAAILDIDQGEIAQVIEDAIVDLAAQAPASVLIIEDEPMISMDLSAIVEDMGHAVAGVAPTHTRALALSKECRPDLILADIQLADGSSGIDAVNDILQEHAVPVIFITAHSERLLTGERPEPVFLVPKPFSAQNLRATIGQALLLAEDREIVHYRPVAAAAS